jgi:hypothetical protein
MSVLKKAIAMSVCALGALSFSDFTPEPGPVMGSANASNPSSSFDTSVAQNTQQALQTFNEVSVKNFLNTEDSDFVGFGTQTSQPLKSDIPVDLKENDGSRPSSLVSETSTDQDAIDAQIEGDWNG